MLDTRDKMSQFIHLHGKSALELRAISEGLGLVTEGTKEELIDRIIDSAPGTPQTNPMEPQAISLSSKDPDGSTSEKAVQVFRKWRKQIFDGKTNSKIFHMLSVNGKAYQQEMKYIRCSVEVASRIIQLGWFYKHDSQKDLVDLISCEPDKFTFSIIRRHSNEGKSFLMLHCQPK